VEVKGSPLAGSLSDDAMRTLAAECEQALAEFVAPSGEIVLPIAAHLATARKPQLSGADGGRPNAGPLSRT
jgi:hypothetical protein